MYSLALKGKLPISEDVITAAVFDSLRGSDAAARFARLLSVARPFTNVPPLPTFDECSFEFWPCGAEGEPDVVATLSLAGAERARIVIEAKLGASKSGIGEVIDDAAVGDQLARYLIAAARRHVETPVVLLYVTHHTVMPREDLAESADELRRRGRGDLVGRLWWLAWRDVEVQLRDRDLGDFPATAAWQLLRRVRMFRFEGIRCCAFNVLPAASQLVYQPLRRRPPSRSYSVEAQAPTNLRVFAYEPRTAALGSPDSVSSATARWGRWQELRLSGLSKFYKRGSP